MITPGNPPELRVSVKAVILAAFLVVSAWWGLLLASVSWQSVVSHVRAYL